MQIKPANRRLTFFIITLIISLSCGCAKCSESGSPLLWKIEGKKSSYLFGTIHIPDERVLKLHSAVKDALKKVEAVFTELPMDMGTQVKMAMKSMLPDNKTLKDVLPADLYTSVEKLFKDKGLPMMAMSRFKIWAVAVQVALIDHLKELAKQPLDMFIYAQAQKDGKEVGGIETIDEQLSVFDSLTQAEQITMLREALQQRQEHAKEGIDFITQLIEIYLKGDENELMKKMMEEYDPTNPLEKKLMKRLFYDRNEIMANRIAKKIKDSPSKSFFFAVGAGHMPGPDGIVERLRKAGFKVTRLGK
ncbi:MAG: TraB/GumN family protein [Deltaproteobacteria bacterium]|nr:TraB/GumN family protein [Deltaproteobacteria bacterium]